MKIKRRKRIIPRKQLPKDIGALSLKAHAMARGKIEEVGRVPIMNLDDLAIYYTPGVVSSCLAIRDNKDLSYDYTSRGNRIAIVTDGSRILGLGGIGPEAGMPVMEGKALLFKKFGNVDAVPLTIRTTTAEEMISFVKAIEPGFGGINIEDTAPPKCFEVVDRLQKELDIPIFHDDRQGTSVVAYAALKNALRLVGKDLKDAKIVINGIGAAGVGIAQLLLAAGAGNIIMCDTRGILYQGRKDDMNTIKENLATHTNRSSLKGQLEDAVKGADVLIGVSSKGAFSDKMIKAMAPRAIVFALANPDPEIDYGAAKAAGAEIVATGVSDLPNQVNNLLAFPAIFRGALDARARKINTAMLLAAADSLGTGVPKFKLSKDHIIPNFTEDDIISITAEMAVAVARAAVETGVSDSKLDANSIRKNVRGALKRYSKIEASMTKLGRMNFLTHFFK